LSLSTQQLSLGLASSSANGALSSTDWTTFNNKQNALTNPVTGTGTTNYLPKFTTTGSTIGNSALQEVSGNLGLGVAPSNWSLVKVLQIGSTSVGGFSNTGYLNANAFFNTSTNWTYVNSSFAARYELNSGDAGVHIWYTAPSGTAGNAISFTQAMTLDASGRLGIGTTPSYKLHIIESTTNGRAVQGVATATSGTNYGAVLVAEGIGATKNIGLYASAEGATTNVAAVFDKGNVGIGTTSPTDTIGYGRALDIQSSTGAVIYLRDSDAPTTQYGFIAYDGNDNGLKLNNENSSGFIRFNTAGSERMRIFSDGNTFIGSSPSNAGFKLDVNGTGRFSGNVTVVSSSSSTSIGTTGQIQITSSTGLAAPAGDIYLQSVIDSATPGDRGTAFVVQTGRTSGIAERFRIASTGAATFSSGIATSGYTASSSYAAIFNGAVGIGTSTPSTTDNLTLSSSTAFNLQLTNPGTGGVTWQIGATSNDYGSGGNRLVFTYGNASANSVLTLVQSTGNVLIGTTTDASYKLDVNGTGRFSAASTDYALTLQNIQDDSQGLLVRATDNDSNLYLIRAQSSNSSTSQTWVDRFTLAKNGAANFSSSVTAASFIPSGSTIPTNGMYLPSANTIAFSTNTTQRISVSSAGEVQLKQSSNSAQNSVIFNTTNQNAMTLNSSGFLILNGTTGSSRITCYGDGYFSGGIQTGNPYGSTSANWLLGRFLTETTSANGSIRVQIGSKYYNIAAEDLGEVPT
jgi:hypothetical protein